MLKENIYYPLPDHYGFGDAWALTNFLLNEASTQNHQIKVIVKQQTQQRIKEIKNHINSNSEIIFEEENYVKRKYNKKEVEFIPLDYTDFFKYPMLPIKTPWTPTNKQIAFQFNGKHLGKEKNPPKQDVDKLLFELTAQGYETINVGIESLANCIEILSKSNMFIGCPSGLSIIAMSVGLPIFLATYQLDNEVMDRLVNNHYKHAKNIHYNKTLSDLIETHFKVTFYAWYP